jgi:beta-galactosidase
MQGQLFDQGWRFHLGDPPEGRGREPDDSTWRVLDLPHDWSIEEPRSAANPSGTSGGFFTMGTGFYRKTFDAPAAWRGQRVYVLFEGVYMNAEIRLNEDYIGRHPYGYTSFWCDLTPYLKLGEPNTLKVAVDNACQGNSRWYSGSGIYRHAWLIVANPIHVGQWGVYVTTPDVAPEAATVRVQTTVQNESDTEQTVTLRSVIVAPGGAVEGSTKTQALIGAGGALVYSQDMTVPQPQLWSPDAPRLYRLETTVLVNDQPLDTAETTFGIRSLHFDAAQGFLLNGQPLKLRGGCVHHDNGVMGSAAFDRSEERKVAVHKASGYNAIRCAHNPPSPAFLDACDRLGMLVMDEAFDCWRDGKNPYDYHVAFDGEWQHDLDSMLLRDRNHPCIILWSIGNEVTERDGRSGGAAIARMLAGRVHAVDSTRPVTSALCGSDRPWIATDAVFAELEVGGYNYQQKQYLTDHERHPERIMVGTESTAKEAFDHWMSVQEHPYVIGDFVWTSLDYLGESGIGRVHFEGDQLRNFLGEYPWHQANCGDLDLCGFKRPQSYYRDILWERGDKLYIAVHTPVPADKTPSTTYWGWPDVAANWTWPGHEGETLKVDVYSACEQVELFLNGTSLGIRPATKEQRFIVSFEVPYAAGTLTAVGYAAEQPGGQPLAKAELATASAPARIHLTPDCETIHAAAGDLGFVTVELVDEAGRLQPNADHDILFTVKGEGTLAAVGSGDPVSAESYRGNQRRAFHGRCLAVVKSNGTAGEIRLRAQADGLDGAEVVIRTV